MGKGDNYRPVDPEKFRRNYDRIFREQRAPVSEDVDDQYDARTLKEQERYEAEAYGGMEPAAWDDSMCDAASGFELEGSPLEELCLDCMGAPCVCPEEGEEDVW